MNLTHNEEVMSVLVSIHLFYVQNYLTEFIEITVSVLSLLGKYSTYYGPGS
jgi:hypothetical protein